MTVFNVFKNQVYSEKSRVCQRKEKGIPRGLNALSVEASVEVAFPV